MTERLLQHIWQFQSFNKSSLATADEQSLEIIHPGVYNTNQGPDFLNAKIKIGNTIWAGSIELHINSSDWQLHNHSNDSNYNNVILHVVWHHDHDLQLAFSTLELQSRVSGLLLNKYEGLMQAVQFIPCESQAGKVDDIIILSWKERMLVERLQHRSMYVESLLQLNNRHWEETFWWMIARNFGMKVNADAFEKMAQTVSVKILAKHKQHPLQVEALLMGQAGLLDKDLKDDHPLMLQKEYHFLQKKYSLHKIHIPVHLLRMRPANFPGIRLSQLAALLQQNEHLFSSILEMKDINDVRKMFSVAASGYWDDHYVFDEPATYTKKKLGKQMTGNIFINTVIPALYAYGYSNNNDSYKNKALRWMDQLAAEKNSITNGFELIGIKNKTAFDSQALIQLKNMYCDHKRCLQCAIGNKILKEN